jgi:hypothetical protein
MKRFLISTIFVTVFFGVWISGVMAIPTTTGTETWSGNGSENNLDNGGSYHWILTPGGGGQEFEVLSATLHVTYVGGSTTETAGTKQSNGAFHFIVKGSKVLSAYASYEYVGTPGNLVLTISSSTPGNTTTTTKATTTTTESPTTTTDPITTTTEFTTTTEVTSTTKSTTTTLKKGTTTTIPETITTVATTTTTTLPTERIEYPFTGGSWALLIISGLFFILSGVVLRIATRQV